MIPPPNLNFNDSGPTNATSTGTFGDFRPAAIQFGGQSSTKWLYGVAAVVAVIYLLRK